MKIYICSLLIVLGFGAGFTARASVVSGTLSTGLSSGPQVVVTSPPVATPAAGTYSSAQSVALTGDNATTAIYYTTDGVTVPGCGTGTLYTSAISVASSETIQAVSCYANNASSTVASFAYVINTPGGNGGGSSGGSSSGSSGGGGGGVTSGTISGLVYSDNNDTGLYSTTTDNVLPGWTVYLDSNNNDSLDSGETSTLSNSSGNYSFNVPLGSYTVREVLQNSTSTPWGQTQPSASSDNHAYTITLTSTSTSASNLNFGNNPRGQVLGLNTIRGTHPDGTLVLDGGTVYLIAGGQLHGFRDPQEFASYGYKFSQDVPISDADKLLPQGDIMKAMVGTLALDTSDNRTVYMVGQNYTKRGFSSYAVFQGLGYVKGSSTSPAPISGLFKINLSDYPSGTPITSAADAHPEGALVRDNSGTVWWILDGQRDGFESLTVFTSYGFTFDRVVPANAADMALPAGSLVKFRDGTLVSQNGVTYIISDGQKLPFSSITIFSSLGYSLSNVIAADISGYTTGTQL